MGGFKDIIGHEDTIQHLQNAIKKNMVSHAYILQGPEGSGKMMLAEAFAQTLQCSQRSDPPDACGTCRFCHQAQTHNHPDILYVQHEKPALISVSEVRTQLVSDVQVKPYYGNRKIYIMEDADKMNPQAQNALLKTLEEPPEYVTILLLTTNAQMLLDTIRSRCVLLNLKSVPDEKITRYLMDQLKVPDYQAKLCTAFAQGSVGKAMQLASSDHFNEIRSNAITLVRRAKQLDVSELAQMAKSMEEYKISIYDFLDILSVWYRDVLYFKASRDPNGIVFQDQVKQVRQNAQVSSYQGIETILQAIGKAKDRLKANVNFDLTMELLFLTIKEN